MPDIMINLAVTGPYQNLFTYKVRPAESAGLTPGCRFLIPFGKNFKTGFFIGFQNQPVTHRLRFVKERLDLVSPFPSPLFDLCRWIADYYYAGLGETLAAALPESRWQFERLGYFCADRRDSRPGAPVFNRTVTLRDEWAKLVRAGREAA